jgi:aminoglycoside/choline kinase family phosphotransferase
VIPRPEPQLATRLATFVGSPVALDELKRKPGRRRTVRARGPEGSVIVKQYVSTRAPTVAARLHALAGGPAQPKIPRVLLLDAEAHLLVLEDLPGEPLRTALLAGDTATTATAGESIGGWHRFWSDAPVPVGALQPHPAEREIAVLGERLMTAENAVADAARSRLTALGTTVWDCSTAIHRDLYEEQILFGESTGLIDLDDSAIGPPELDVGNVLAHVRLLGLRSGRDLDPMVEAFLDGYVRTGPPLARELLERCLVLSLLRLACIHGELALVHLADCA